MEGRVSGEYQPGPGGLDNPSSAAAAAAAAAAKAFSGGPPPGGRSGWPEGRDDPYAYDRPVRSSVNWPVDEGRGGYRYPPGAGYVDGYPPRYSRPDGRSGYSERGYRESRMHHYDDRHTRHRSHYPPDYRYSHGPREIRPAGQQQHRGEATNHLIVGGTTPIHVPKSKNQEPIHGSLDRSLRRAGGAESVFRGRPSSSEADVAAVEGGMEEDDSPQNILMSLRTPTASFEERSGEKKGSDGAPMIQHLDQPKTTEFFEVSELSYYTCDDFLHSHTLQFSHSFYSRNKKTARLTQLRLLLRFPSLISLLTVSVMDIISMLIQRCKTIPLGTWAARRA
jgi:hypothetical protein